MLHGGPARYPPPVPGRRPAGGRLGAGGVRTAAAAADGGMAAGRRAAAALLQPCPAVGQRARRSRRNRPVGRDRSAVRHRGLLPGDRCRAGNGGPARADRSAGRRAGRDRYRAVPRARAWQYTATPAVHHHRCDHAVGVARVGAAPGRGAPAAAAPSSPSPRCSSRCSRGRSPKRGTGLRWDWPSGRVPRSRSAGRSSSPLRFVGRRARPAPMCSREDPLFRDRCSNQP